MMHEALTVMINALLTASEQELELAKLHRDSDRDFVMHMTVSTICSRLAASYIEVRKEFRK